MTIISTAVDKRSRDGDGVALISNKRVWNAILGCNLKMDGEMSVHFKGKLFNITVIQAYVHTINDEETKVGQFSEDLEDLLELTPKKMFYSSLEIRMLKWEVKIYLE